MSIKFSELIGDRIDLINLNHNYIMDIHEYSVIPVFYKYLEYDSFKTFEDTKTFFEKISSRSNDIDCHYWMIYNKKDDKVLGTIALHDIDWRKGFAELTYGLSPNYWGNGFFSESLNLIVNWFFSLKNTNRLFLKTVSINNGSINAVSKFGFKKEGVLREYYLDEKTNTKWDATLFSLLRSDLIK
tara:strand:- start:405 stop:959 length:555 start_codon:yes stop_codon:yes gene_type:complete